MTIKGVLFDKDGTLIDFFSLWLQAAFDVVPKLMKVLELGNSPQLEQYLLATIGIVDGQISPEGGFCYKSYGELANDIVEALEKKNIYKEIIEVHMALVKLFDDFATSEAATFNTFTPMRELLLELRKRDIKIGLATADTIYSAKYCLTRLGVIELFDYIGGDDGITKPKPNPDMFHRFIKRFDLLPQQVAMVGDTQTDMEFAKECGAVAIGVLSGVSKEENLKDKGDYIISSVGKLIPLLDEI